MQGLDDQGSAGETRSVFSAPARALADRVGAGLARCVARDLGLYRGLDGLPCEGLSVGGCRGTVLGAVDREQAAGLASERDLPVDDGHEVVGVNGHTVGLDDRAGLAALDGALAEGAAAVVRGGEGRGGGVRRHAMTLSEDARTSQGRTPEDPRP